jgi:hypothetical protein
MSIYLNLSAFLIVLELINPSLGYSHKKISNIQIFEALNVLKSDIQHFCMGYGNSQGKVKITSEIWLKDSEFVHLA